MKYLLSLYTIILCSGALYASDATQFVTKQKKFIKTLYAEGRYFDCIAETRRLLVYDDANDHREDWQFFIDASYFLGKQYKSVVHNILQDRDKRSFRYSLLLSRAYLKLNLFDESLKALPDIDAGQADLTILHELFYRRSEVLLYKKEYLEMYAECKKLGPIGTEFQELESFEKKIASYKKYGFKSVGLSIALSVFIPGAGQMYAGKYWQGVLSFLSVAITATGAYFSYMYDLKQISYTLICFSALFYAGNIYGAYNAAHHRNNSLHRKFREGVLKEYIPPYRPIDDAFVEGAFQ